MNHDEDGGTRMTMMMFSLQPADTTSFFFYIQKARPSFPKPANAPYDGGASYQFEITPFLFSLSFRNYNYYDEAFFPNRKKKEEKISSIPQPYHALFQHNSNHFFSYSLLTLLTLVQAFIT